jgi:hypothetical protein
VILTADLARLTSQQQMSNSPNSALPCPPGAIAQSVPALGPKQEPVAQITLMDEATDIVQKAMDVARGFLGQVSRRITRRRGNEHTRDPIAAVPPKPSEAGAMLAMV